MSPAARRGNARIAKQAKDAQRDPISAKQEVFRNRTCGAHGGIEARCLAVDPTGRSDISKRVDEQSNVVVLIGIRRCHMQLSAAQRTSPVDSAKSIADLEWSDTSELAPIARLRRPSEANEAVGTVHWWRCIENLG